MPTKIADWSMYQSAFTGDPRVFADKYNPNKWVVDIDFRAVANSDVDGIIIRVGISQLKDPCFDRYRAGLRQFRIPWGIYHAYDPGRAPRAQADLIRAWCPTSPPLGVFGDIEMGNANFDGVEAYFQALDGLFKRTTGIYSANWYMAPRFTVEQQSRWLGRPAWFAGYPNLVVPAGWVGRAREYDLHQFTNNARMPGVPRVTDMNLLHDTLTLADLTAAQPIPERDVVRGPVARPARARFGLHGRADGRMAPADFQVVQDGRIEAVKLMSTADPVDVDRLRAIDPGMLIVVRCFVDFKNRVITPSEFAQMMAGDLAPFYAKGVRYFEVHNEPNLAEEGLIMDGRPGSWADGAAFGAWYRAAIALLTQLFPDAVWGWPGFSPGGAMAGVRADAVQFLAQAGSAPASADWIGMHAYWINDAELEVAIDSVIAFAAAFPGQKLFVTEYANPDVTVPKATKARQYVQFGARIPADAAFAFVVSASNPQFAEQAWRNEAGNLSEIPAIVGARTTLPARWWEAWPNGAIAPARRLASPPSLIEMFKQNGQPLVPPVRRKNSMDVFERQGNLLRVLQQPINGELWWVRAEDVQPA